MPHHSPAATRRVLNVPLSSEERLELNRVAARMRLSAAATIRLLVHREAESVPVPTPVPAPAPVAPATPVVTVRVCLVPRRRRRRRRGQATNSSDAPLTPPPLHPLVEAYCAALKRGRSEV